MPVSLITGVGTGGVGSGGVTLNAGVADTTGSNTVISAHTTGTFQPSTADGLIAWYRFNTGITETGLGVSQWDDQTGLGHHLLQATDANRPAKQGDGSILFDGITQYLKTSSFTLNQPETIYILFKQITWATKTFIDGNAVNSGRLVQQGVTPNIQLFAGSNVGQNSNLAVGVYGAVAGVINGASSVLQVGNTTPTTGNAGAANMGGLTLGALASGITPANMQVKEVLICSSAHDAETRAKYIAYLNTI